MRQQLIDLRNRMKAHGFDAILIPTTDFHGSEYIHDWFQCRKFVSGFTGSAGTLVVTQDQAKLWTDGRYFIQAAQQLEGSGIDLMKMGQPDVPTIFDYLKSSLNDNAVVAFDGRLISNSMGRQLEEIFEVVWDMDLIDEIWTERPPIAPSEIYPLPDWITGETAASKLNRLRQFMEAKDADYHLITQLEDIAWLYNLRGSDIPHTPVFFAFALITKSEDRLYVMDQSFNGGLPYLQLFDDLSSLPDGAILLDENIVSYGIVKSLPETVSVISEKNPTTLMKAIKNPVEIQATKNAHLKDGAAMVNFIYWLKTYRDYAQITELSAGEYLETCRRQQNGFVDTSFQTISAYGENGAIVHYTPTTSTNKALNGKGFLLVDSGGQYEDGTTDVTRTIALGPLSHEMKVHYTTVLRGHIALAMAGFPAGTTGADLDKLARKPVSDLGLDYNHGTGHGVGHLLSCHEGPQTISPRGGRHAIVPGMICSNEPGIYIEGRYGIRLENEILCIEDNLERYSFETISYCPFDTDAILPDLLTNDEKLWLQQYHKDVYEKIGPLVSEDVRMWLKEEILLKRV